MKKIRNKNPLLEIKSSYIEFQRGIRNIKQQRKLIIQEYRTKLEALAKAKINEHIKNV